MPQTIWKSILWFFVVGGVLFLFFAVLLVTTTHTLDLHIRDRYMVIAPGHLFVVSVVLLIASFVVWKAGVSH